MSPASVLRWSLWSRRNLAVTVLAAAVVVAVVGRFAGGGNATAAPPVPVQASTHGGEPLAPTYTPTATATPTGEPVKDPRTDLLATTTGFVTAWARPSLPEPAWLAGVKPYTTPVFAKALATTDPGRVPATRVIGEPVLNQYGPGWAWAWVDVTTDGGTVVVSLSSVTVAPEVRRWTVTAIAPAPGGAP